MGEQQQRSSVPDRALLQRTNRGTSLSYRPRDEHADIHHAVKRIYTTLTTRFFLRVIPLAGVFLVLRLLAGVFFLVTAALFFFEAAFFFPAVFFFAVTFFFALAFLRVTFFLPVPTFFLAATFFDATFFLVPTFFLATTFLRAALFFLDTTLRATAFFFDTSFFLTTRFLDAAFFFDADFFAIAIFQFPLWVTSGSLSSCASPTFASHRLKAFCT